jgi:hypothetical protein
MSLPTRHEHALRSPASSTETFTDAAKPSGLLHPTIGGGGGSASRPPPDSWAAELSGSFAIIASQLQNASRTIAAAPAAAHHHDHHLAARLDAIEQAQERLAVELAALRSLHAGKSRDEIPASSGGSLPDIERRLTEALAAQKLEYVEHQPYVLC